MKKHKSYTIISKLLELGTKLCKRGTRDSWAYKDAPGIQKKYCTDGCPPQSTAGMGLSTSD